MLARIAVAIVLGNEAHAVEDDEGTSDEKTKKIVPTPNTGKNVLKHSLSVGDTQAESQARALSRRELHDRSPRYRRSCLRDGNAGGGRS